MQLNRYEMLTKLHEVVQPRTYLEIGVQTGASFVLAKGAEHAVGVDPDFSGLTYDINWPHATLCETTSDAFFAAEPYFVDIDGKSDVDLVFIDGMHRVENVARDLYNSMLISHARTIIALDDVLPRNDEEAVRDMIPGDWTGDVYKIVGLLDDWGIPFWLVDTFPTGMLIIQAFNLIGPNAPLARELNAAAEREATQPVNVPRAILNRTNVTDPQTILDEIAKRVSRA